MKKYYGINRLKVIGQILCINMILAVFFAHGVHAAVPSVLAESAILINAQTGRVIFEKNADVRRAPASLTKMMTCILGLEAKGLNADFRVSQAAAATEDSYLEMKSGDRFRSGELMREMMMESDNGAAVVVAQNVSDSILKFADLMNEKAKVLGCRKTHFSNPHGLTAKWHYSTARDMAKIAAYCMKNPDFRSLVNNRKSVIHWALPAGRTYKSETTNELLGSYSGANGIKTGWTNAAKGCVAASAKRGDVELIAIVMKSKDHQTRFADARKLLDYGFSVGGKGNVAVEPSATQYPKRAPEIKKPGAVAAPVADKPVPALKPAVVSSVPVTGSSNRTADTTTRPAMANNPSPAVSGADTGAVASPGKTEPVISSQPTVKSGGIRMPVVRKPGA